MLSKGLVIRRALLTVSDKTGVVELGRALADAGVEIVATGKTGELLKQAGISVIPIEKISGSPEAFQGRMKTLSSAVCSGILYRRGDPSDEADLKRLAVQPIDCVVVNFYPFEKAVLRVGITHQEKIEEVDIGGPTLVRAAAKNSAHVLVLTDPRQYEAVIQDLKAHREVSRSVVDRCASEAWGKVSAYDAAISCELGIEKKLRYGENPHQKAVLKFDALGPIDWETQLTPLDLSYNNIWDLSAAYALMSDLKVISPSAESVVIVKHNNPCGVAVVPKGGPLGENDAQLQALIHAWEGDPTSAFGGVLIFSSPISRPTAQWLSERFVELVAAPDLTVGCESLKIILAKRKNLKAVCIRRFGESPAQSTIAVPGGVLIQDTDLALGESLKSVTIAPWATENDGLGRFGIAVTRALKSNAVALVRKMPDQGFQLIGAGQGQPNRIEALEKLAIPRASEVLKAVGGKISECILVSDAFFPFRDTVESAHRAGIKAIIQPGGSIKDAESIAACNEAGISMVFTGVRHFRH